MQMHMHMQQHQHQHQQRASAQRRQSAQQHMQQQQRHTSVLSRATPSRTAPEDGLLRPSARSRRPTTTARRRAAQAATTSATTSAAATPTPTTGRAGHPSAWEQSADCRSHHVRRHPHRRHGGTRLLLVLPCLASQASPTRIVETMAKEANESLLSHAATTAATTVANAPASIAHYELDMDADAASSRVHTNLEPFAPGG